MEIGLVQIVVGPFLEYPLNRMPRQLEPLEEDLRFIGCHSFFNNMTYPIRVGCPLRHTFGDAINARRPHSHEPVDSPQTNVAHDLADGAPIRCGPPSELIPR